MKPILQIISSKVFIAINLSFTQIKKKQRYHDPPSQFHKLEPILNKKETTISNFKNCV